MDEPVYCFGPSIMADAPRWPEVHRRRLEDCGPLVECEAQRITEANRQRTRERALSHHAHNRLPRECRPSLHPRVMRTVTFRGETLTIEQWAQRLGVNADTIRYRLRKWPLEVALTLPRQRLA